MSLLVEPYTLDFESEPVLLERFLDFPRQHYAGDPNWLPDPSERLLLTAGANPGAIWRNFLILTGDKILGRVTAILNPRLYDENQQPYGLLGFFECVNDHSTVRQLLNSAVAWLQGNAPEAVTILAPINFDTWHPYRLRTSGFDQPTFLMEPYNPPFYPELLISAGFTQTSQYVSKTVNQPSELMAAWQPYHQQAISKGFSFRSFDPANVDSEMAIIHKLSIGCFSKNLFFSEISEAQFRGLYAGIAGKVDPDLVFFLLDPALEPVGFTFSVRDHRQPKAANFKTYGILPGVRGAGIGAALACEAYSRFQAKGFTRVNHCLMRAGNRADQFDRGLGQITREYKLYSRPLRS